MFNKFHILKGNAGVKYYMHVVLLVSREIVTPNAMRISSLTIKYTETYIRIDVYKHFYLGKPDDNRGCLILFAYRQTKTGIFR